MSSRSRSHVVRTMAQNERRFRNGHMPHRYYGTPTTTVKASMNVLNRASYFRRHVVSGELTYDWATSAQHHHSFSPLVLSYEYMNSRSAAFDSIISQHPYLQISMRDQFVPKMSYTYTYNSQLDYRSPITWSTTVSEAGNILATGYMIGGRKWNEDRRDTCRRAGRGRNRRTKDEPSMHRSGKGTFRKWKCCIHGAAG